MGPLPSEETAGSSVKTAVQVAPRQILRAARRGARSVTSKDLWIREAAERALEKLEDRILRGRSPRSPKAWAYRVGQREAVRLVRMGKGRNTGQRVPAPKVCRDLVTGKEDCLTPAMLRAVHGYIKVGSQHLAARALRMDRSNLRRTLLRALRRVLRG
jgi:DNA-directed RNA polymerase specialized sigma24 family protein